MLCDMFYQLTGVVHLSKSDRWTTPPAVGALGLRSRYGREYHVPSHTWRLVLVVFPKYGAPAIAMELFRRFLAGMNPVLHAQCHEHGATLLVEALAVSCRWKQAQTSSPTCSHTSLHTGDNFLFSTRCATTSQSDQSPPNPMNAMKWLSEDVRALKLEVAHLQQHHEHSATCKTTRSTAETFPGAGMTLLPCLGEHGRDRQVQLSTYITWYSHLHLLRFFSTSSS